ncbi:MAG: hypothetical protein ACLGJB_04245 [Blastocatellia bacterium]
MRKPGAVILIAALLLFNFLSAGPAYAARPAARPAQSADELLRMLPGSDAIVIVNVAQLSVQAQAMLGQDKELASKYQSRLNRLSAETGVNIQAIEQLAAGFSFNQAEPRPSPVIVLSGTFDQDQILARLSGGTGNKWKAKKYKGQRLYLEPAGANAKSGSRAAIAFFDDQSKVAFGSNADVRRVIDARAGDRPSAANDAALMAALHRTSESASVRFAFAVPEEVRQKLRTASGVPALLRPLASITEVVGSADLGENGLQANASLVTASPAEAADLVTLINQGLALAKVAAGNYPGGELIVSILNGASVSQSGNAANVSASVPADLIRSLIGELRSKGVRR